MEISVACHYRELDLPGFYLLLPFHSEAKKISDPEATVSKGTEPDDQSKL